MLVDHDVVDVVDEPMVAEVVSCPVRRALLGDEAAKSDSHGQTDHGEFRRHRPDGDPHVSVATLCVDQHQIRHIGGEELSTSADDCLKYRLDVLKRGQVARCLEQTAEPRGPSAVPLQLVSQLRDDLELPQGRDPLRIAVLPTSLDSGQGRLELCARDVRQQHGQQRFHCRHSSSKNSEVPWERAYERRVVLPANRMSAIEIVPDIPKLGYWDTTDICDNGTSTHTSYFF